MTTSRLVGPLLAGALAVLACSERQEEGEVARPPASKTAPAQPPAPPVQPPAAATEPVGAGPGAGAGAETSAAAPAPGGVPPSGDAAQRRDPDFYLPADSELTTTPSGLKYLVVREGSGTSPTATSQVTVHYIGWLTDGQSFDSSYSGGEPLNMAIKRFVAGWQEALQLMKPGGECILVVPPQLGYGEQGMPPVIPPSATLVFRMELLSFSG